MKKFFTAASMLAIAACSQETEETKVSNADLAMELAQNTLIIDTHIDVPYRLADKWEDVTNATEGGDFDYDRAVKGGLNAPFMSIYTPAQYDGTEKATKHADEMIDLVEKIVATAPEKFIIAKSVADVEEAFAKGLIALPLGMENGSPINGSMENLDHFYERGIRYITLTHAKANHISDSSYDVNHRWNGISEFGAEVVAHMNELGIMVDISHVSDEAFWAVLKVSKAPLIASHSSARHFTPGFERNMNDEMITALGKAGGVIMISFGSPFITEVANKYRPAMAEAYQAYLADEGMDDSTDLKEAFEKEYLENNPFPYSELSDVLDHIDHAVKLGGIDAVGLGSDFDGMGDTLPNGLKDVSNFPGLIEGLLERAYSEEDVKKILSGNLLRVWRQVEEVAAKS